MSKQKLGYDYHFSQRLTDKIGCRKHRFRDSSCRLRVRRLHANATRVRMINIIRAADKLKHARCTPTPVASFKGNLSPARDGRQLREIKSVAAELVQ